MYYIYGIFIIYYSKYSIVECSGHYSELESFFEKKCYAKLSMLK